MNRTGPRGGCTFYFAGLVILLVAMAALISQSLAQGTPNPVTPGYPVCRDTSGSTVCSWQADFACTNSAPVTVAVGTTVQIVALTANQSIGVCSFTITGDTVATIGTFVYGTGANCGTGTTPLTGAMRISVDSHISPTASRGALFSTATGNALCLTAATGTITGFVTYGKY